VPGRDDMPQGASRAAAARDDVGPVELRAMEGELHLFLHELTNGNRAHAASIMTTALRYISQGNFEVRPNPFGSYPWRLP